MFDSKPQIVLYSAVRFKRNNLIQTEIVLSLSRTLGNIFKCCIKADIEQKVQLNYWTSVGSSNSLSNVC